jgi:microcystin-dependent protein
MAKGDAGSGLYSPDAFDTPQDPQALLEHVQRQLSLVSGALEIGLARYVEFLNAPPDKPREGMIRGADGTNWNPGSGKGLYIYVDATWKRLVTQDVLDAAIAAIPSGFTTGDVKVTVKTVADTGWVLMDDKTIGDASSGATGRANADTVNLFTLLWNNTADADCPVSTGRGASAAADFAAHKTIALPKTLGRVLATYGAGSGLTSRALGSKLGEEAHAQTSSEMATHNHGVTDSGHTHGFGGNTVATFNGPGGADYATGGGAFIGSRITFSATDNNATGLTVNNSGSGTAANVMQPTVFLNVMIKL